MLKLFRATRSNIFVWILMGLLIVGLAGFGIGVGGGLGGRDVARVGDRPVDADDFARAMTQELNALTMQTGRSISVAEARQFGIDRMVLARLINEAALDGEAARLGLSVGDDTVRSEILAAPSFRGLDGNFDRSTYTFALQRLGLTASGFEDMLRREATRGLVSTGVQSATAMPESGPLTLLGHIGEARGFDWIRLDAALLPEALPAPSEADLVAWHTDHPERYTRPETQVITYAAVRPGDLAATIEISEDELRDAYDAAGARFHTPERRILDRIGFATDADAAAARARLDAGEIDFDALAAERGLSATEIDQGPVVATTLSPEAREAVFGHEGPGILGPVPTPLGPSLYRINAVLAERIVPFEEARAELARERALDEARRRIAAETAAIDDLIAGGATLEEIAEETVMELGTVALNEQTEGGIAQEQGFITLAASARQGQETDLAELSDGGLVALRLEAIEPAAVIPLDEVRDRVAADLVAARTAEALSGVAEGFRDELAGGLDFTELATRIGRTLHTVAPRTRNDPPPDVPRALVAEIFAADEGEVLVHIDGDGVILAELTTIAPFDPAQPEAGSMLAMLRDQYREQAANDVLALFVAALRDRSGVYVNESLIDSTLTRFQ